LEDISNIHIYGFAYMNKLRNRSIIKKLKTCTGQGKGKGTTLPHLWTMARRWIYHKVCDAC